MPYKSKKLKGIQGGTLDKLTDSVIDLAKWTEDEFAQLATDLQATEPDTIWNVVPPRPRRGTYAYADGTHWNPGFGEGPYFFNGSLWLPMSAEAPGNYFGAIVAVRRQIFTASGTYTPNANLVYGFGRGVGGGGGGGGCAGAANFAIGAGGGGAGSYSELLFTKATIGASQTVTIGALGNGGVAGFNAGSAGTQTSLGSLLTAPGGSGGSPANSATYGHGAPGGAAGTGDTAIPGQHGEGGSYFGLVSSGISVVGIPGMGGSGPFGAGGYGPGNGAGQDAGGFGAGGGGAAANTAVNNAGGKGSPGYLHILEFCSA